MSVLNKTGKMLQHDTYVGLRQCIWIYPITVLYILSVCIVFDKKFFSWADLQTVSEQSPAVGDYLAYLFQGMEIYQINLQNGFQLPAIWMMMFLLFVLSVAKYPKSDLYGIGQQLLLKSGSRNAWWGAKLIWTVICAVVYYAVCFLTIFIYLALVHGIKWQPSNFTVAVIPGLENLSLAESVLWLVVTPILTMCTIGSLELLLSIIVAPVFSVIIIVSMLLAVLYFNFTYLPGGTCILLRSVLTIPYGFKLSDMVSVLGIEFLLNSSIGCYCFKNLDLHKNREV